MNDEIVRAMTKDGFVKAVGITSTGIVERARQIHKTLPTATAALGRLLTAASMMGNMQKVEDGSITLQVKGGGPLGTILAVSDAQGNVRGYVENPQISLLEKYRGKLDVGAAVGKDGTLTVIRDLRMKEPYIGSIALVSGEIAEDVTQYFAQSEQIPTVCALGVLVDTDQSVLAAGGYLIQLLPGAPEEVISRIEAGIAEVGAVTQMLDGGGSWNSCRSPSSTSSSSVWRRRPSNTAATAAASVWPRRSSVSAARSSERSSRTGRPSMSTASSATGFTTSRRRKSAKCWKIWTGKKPTEFLKRHLTRSTSFCIITTVAEIRGGGTEG